MPEKKSPIVPSTLSSVPSRGGSIGNLSPRSGVCEKSLIHSLAPSKNQAHNQSARFLAEHDAEISDPAPSLSEVGLDMNVDVPFLG